MDERGHHGARVVLDDLGNSDAHGREDSRVTRDEHALDAQARRELARMLWPRAAERDEREVPGVVPPFERDGAQRALHHGVGDAHDAQRRLPAVGAHAGGKALDGLPRPPGVDCHTAVQEALGRHPAQEQVGVGHGG